VHKALTIVLNACVQSLSVSLTNDVSHISQLLAVHRSWKEKVSQALSCSEDCLTKAELIQLQVLLC
jgi:hypothetical protein